MVLQRQVLILGCCAAAALLAACGGGSGEGLDSSGRPLVPGGAAGGALVASFASIQERVLTPLCTVCHAGSAAPVGLRLDAGNSYAPWWAWPAPRCLRCGAWPPAAPTTATSSRSSKATRRWVRACRLGGPYLDAATVAVIRQWIAAGALAAEVRP
jgi:hypothetical protein